MGSLGCSMEQVPVGVEPGAHAYPEDSGLTSAPITLDDTAVLSSIAGAAFETSAQYSTQMTDLRPYSFVPRDKGLPSSPRTSRTNRSRCGLSRRLSRRSNRRRRWLEAATTISAAWVCRTTHMWSVGQNCLSASNCAVATRSGLQPVGRPDVEKASMQW